MNQHQKNRRIKLIRMDLKMNEIAKMLGVSRQAINNEMAGVKKSKRIREALCKLTQTPEEKFFPEHHQEDGNAE